MMTRPDSRSEYVDCFKKREGFIHISPAATRPSHNDTSSPAWPNLRNVYPIWQVQTVFPHASPSPEEPASLEVATARHPLCIFAPQVAFDNGKAGARSAVEPSTSPAGASVIQQMCVRLPSMEWTGTSNVGRLLALLTVLQSASFAVRLVVAWMLPHPRQPPMRCKLSLPSI